MTLTQAAAERVAGFIQQEKNSLGLRFGVKKTGCNGYAYVINMAQDIAANDTVFEDQGIKIIVDAESLPFLAGTQIDFVKQGLNEAFQFRNPKVTGECGCGESFSI
ncbi:MAG: iron-sulfur cluster assembly accessory protein [Gammaproteobacteria bacterium]|nr:iron-sulfur cluster assembly accessory protein [Gammaproteobacteria bacterium]